MAHILPEIIVKKISTKIISGEFLVGERIPNEQEIAQELKVSRNTVREAIKILVSRNVLEIRRGTGTFVCENPGLIDDPFGFYFMDKSKMAEYLYEARRAIEPEIVTLAVQRASEEEISELIQIAKGIEAELTRLSTSNKPKDRDKALEINLEFHIAIAKMSHNPILERMMPIICNYLLELHSIEEFQGYKSLEANSPLMISLAIQARDADKAKQLIIEHMEIPSIAYIKKSK